MTRPILTLTTDFGVASPYVAQMKAAILSICRQATLIDITHAIGAQDIRQGALVLAEVAPRFPSGTLHIAVVDPGVGTVRNILYAEIAGQRFVAPDNGLLSGLTRHRRPDALRVVNERGLWAEKVSCTFHGRDIMAPVAARLALGLDPARLGPAADTLIELPWAEVVVNAGKVQGRIESIDSFGNLITDITADKLEGAPRDEHVVVECDEHQTFGIFNAYGDQPPLTLIALFGSSGRLELSIVNESAAIMLGVRVGAAVVVRWPVA